MDFATRNRYRTAIEVIARGTELTEIDVAKASIDMAASGDTAQNQEPGYWLIDAGRAALEKKLQFRPSFKVKVLRAIAHLGLAGYLTAIAIVSVAILVFALALIWAQGAGIPALIILAITGLAIAADAGTAIVNLTVTRSVSPAVLPGLDLSKGVPSDLRTLVVVPVLLHDIEELQAQIEQLEVHHLSSAGGALHFALLSDAMDAQTETAATDETLVATALAAIAELNQRYPAADCPLFYVLHRRRLWSPGEGVWMGWERKRGKLVELNRLLRGATDTSFEIQSGPLPQDVHFVITLDADTRLLRGTVHQMVGKMAHPLNRPVFDPVCHQVTRGYGIVQPRVTADLPLGQDGSIYQRIFSSPGGIDPYVTATSDLYQDLFHEGSFAGKGIYDVDTFDMAIAGRFPDNAVLSHDLLEGIFARAALASDIEVVEDFPTRYDVDMRRRHRWVRGDWQLLPWIFGKRGTENGGIPALGRWKMIDNLRRSLLAPLTMLTLFAGWMMALDVGLIWTIVIVGLLALPRLLPLPFGFVPARAGVTPRSHFAALGKDTLTALGQIALSMVLLADTAVSMLDAIVRTVWRLAVSRRHLLEWVTAARARGSVRPSVAGQYQQMATGVILGLGVCGAAAVVNPAIDRKSVV